MSRNVNKWHSTVLAALLIAFVIAPATSASTPPPETSLVMQSATGEYVGQGQNYSYSETDGTYSAVTWDNGESVNISVIGPSFSFWWYLDFGAEPGNVLAPGTYTGCTRWPFNNIEAGLSIGGNGRGCNALSGSFTVHEIVFGADENVTSLWITFSQNCENLGLLLTGEIKINATTVAVDPSTWGKIKNLYR